MRLRKPKLGQRILNWPGLRGRRRTLLQRESIVRLCTAYAAIGFERSDNAGNRAPVGDAPAMERGTREADALGVEAGEPVAARKAVESLSRKSGWKADNDFPGDEAMLAGRRNSAARGRARSPGGYGVVDAFADRTGGATHRAKWIREGLGEARGHARNRHTKPDPVLYRRRRQTNSWHAYLESGAADSDVSDAWSTD